MSKPILAVTLGDAAGSGPELITKAFVDPEVRVVCRPVVIGDAATVAAALAITKAPNCRCGVVNGTLRSEPILPHSFEFNSLRRPNLSSAFQSAMYSGS